MGSGMMQKKAYTAPRGTVVSTSVDPMGLQVLIEFDDEGRFETSDPGLITVLDQLAARGTAIRHEMKEM